MPAETHVPPQAEARVVDGARHLPTKHVPTRRGVSSPYEEAPEKPSV